MKAILVESNKLYVGQVIKPIPHANEVLIKVKYSALNRAGL